MCERYSRSNSVSAKAMLSDTNEIEKTRTVKTPKEQKKHQSLCKVFYTADCKNKGPDLTQMHRGSERSTAQVSI